MNTKRLALIIVGLILASCGSTKTSTNDLALNNPIESSINLSGVTNDKAPVTINPGRFTVENVTYHIPKTVPGTYQIDNYGRFIEEFKAYDYKGNEMPVTKPDVNSWTIANAKQLDKISYLVNDTYDLEIEGGIGKKFPFSPSGTNIQPENYVLNLHGFIGYFDSLKSNQYKLNVTAPSEFVRTSALQNTNTVTSEDGKNITTTYFAPRYFEITDNPMMYGDLDVEEFQVGDVKIVLSVYSPNKLHSAKSLKDTFFKMMEAQKRFLGDIDATKRYDIFVYLSDGEEGSAKGFGALEHHTSTLVVMPENYPEDALAESMTDIVAHEFFHILTPLSVHSEYVHYFDYNNPTFSKHLWMYEGLTEYFAQFFQINQGLISETEFYNRMMDKIDRSMSLNDTMSFITMSENVADQPYKDQYGNVYQKGALIGMCIDIIMREESNGERGVLSLMQALSKKYGKDKPFEDDKIIDEIVAMTYPSIGTFFENHIIGNTSIDYDEILAKVGLERGITKKETSYVTNGGNLIISANSNYGTVFFNDAVSENSFWTDNGVQPGDIIKAIDGTEVNLQNANQVLQKVFSWEVGQSIEVKLNRKGEEVIVKTLTTQSYTNGESIHPIPNASEAQVKLREAWLKG